MRNPKDQLVSWYYHAMRVPALKQDCWKDVFPRNETEFYDSSLSGRSAVTCQSLCLFEKY